MMYIEKGFLILISSKKVSAPDLYLVNRIWDLWNVVACLMRKVVYILEIICLDIITERVPYVVIFSRNKLSLSKSILLQHGATQAFHEEFANSVLSEYLNYATPTSFSSHWFASTYSFFLTVNIVKVAVFSFSCDTFPCEYIIFKIKTFT